MCGRFVEYRSLPELRRDFPIDHVGAGIEAAANYNVAPTQAVLAIVRHSGRNVLQRLHWGLVPFWARDTTVGNRMINARQETVADKPSFRDAFRKRRCLILADGFYEWQGPPGRKQPLFITLPDDKPFGFAGLWEAWDNRGRNAQVLHSCAIVTTAASPALRVVHARMPVVLKPEAYAAWLDTAQQDAAGLLAHLPAWTQTDFVFRPVSRAVNTVQNNSAALLDPVPGAPSN
jgi:putative SOS response-associated peptidase YedK